MTRYWISMDEALWCALSTAECAAPGEVLMPACGEPVPIMDTARRLAGWYRPERVTVPPPPPYPINCTGIRPGERLHEVLLSPNESFAEGPAAGLLAVRTTRAASRLADVPDMVDELRRLVEADEQAGLGPGRNWSDSWSSPRYRSLLVYGSAASLSRLAIRLSCRSGWMCRSASCGSWG